MGFLDDAIREHLDLKRRRGADPTEVQRAEREALGPVRRDAFEHAEDAPEAEITGGEPVGAYDQTAEPDHEEYEADGDEWGDAFEEEPPPAERELEPAAEEEEPGHEPEPVVEPEPLAEEPFAEEPPLPAPDPPERGAGAETQEYDVEETFAEKPAHAPDPPAHEEPPQGEEDVLEETPEFLQDAPEHDRLWFEQRPPRDFDFDG